MTFFSAIPVPETQIGLAFETTRGEPAAPAYWIPVMGPKYKPDLQLLPDEGLRGSMVSIYDEVNSLRKDGHGWDQYPYLDTFPVFLKALLGPDHKTAAPATTELSEAAAKGATEVKVAGTGEAESWVVIGTGATLETHYVPAVAEAGKKLTLATPLIYAQANKAAVAGLTKHRFSLLNNAASEGNQPKSVTITDVSGEEHARAIPACQLDALSISGSADSLPKVSVAWFGNAATTPSEPTPSFSAVEAPPGWTVTAAIGGTSIGYLMNWGFDFKRNVKPVPALTATQNYYQMFADKLDPTAKITVLEDRKATWLAAYEAGERLSLDITLSDIKSGYALNLHSTEAKFTGAELDRSKEWSEVPLEVQLLPSANDALSGGVSPIVATVANGTTTEY